MRAIVQHLKHSLLQLSQWKAPICWSARHWTAVLVHLQSINIIHSCLRVMRLQPRRIMKIPIAMQTTVKKIHGLTVENTSTHWPEALGIEIGLNEFPSAVSNKAQAGKIRRALFETLLTWEKEVPSPMKPPSNFKLCAITLTCCFMDSLCNIREYSYSPMALPFSFTNPSINNKPRNLSRLRPLVLRSATFQTVWTCLMLNSPSAIFSWSHSILPLMWRNSKITYEQHCCQYIISNVHNRCL